MSRLLTTVDCDRDTGLPQVFSKTSTKNFTIIANTGIPRNYDPSSNVTHMAISKLIHHLCLLNNLTVDPLIAIGCMTAEIIGSGLLFNIIVIFISIIIIIVIVIVIFVIIIIIIITIIIIIITIFITTIYNRANRLTYPLSVPILRFCSSLSPL